MQQSKVLEKSGLPLYQSHKVVGGLKIAAIERRFHQGIRVAFEDPMQPPRDVALQGKPEPKTGWYYVLYSDGYESFSPPDAFENGYTAMGDSVDMQFTRDEISSLTFALGLASGRHLKDNDQFSFYKILALANKIHAHYADWTPYEIPEDRDGIAPAKHPNAESH